MEMYVSVDGKPADVEIYRDGDGALMIGIHWRNSGYTGFAPINNVKKRRMLAAGIGGCAHWTQLDVRIGGTVIEITPKYPGKDFEKWCDDAIAA